MTHRQPKQKLSLKDLIEIPTIRETRRSFKNEQEKYDKDILFMKKESILSVIVDFGVTIDSREEIFNVKFFPNLNSEFIGLWKAG